MNTIYSNKARNYGYRTFMYTISTATNYADENNCSIKDLDHPLYSWF